MKIEIEIKPELEHRFNQFKNERKIEDNSEAINAMLNCRYLYNTKEDYINTDFGKVYYRRNTKKWHSEGEKENYITWNHYEIFIYLNNNFKAIANSLYQGDVDKLYEYVSEKIDLKLNLDQHIYNYPKHIIHFYLVEESPIGY